MASAMTADALRNEILRFTEAFNREDLDGVMSFFGEDSLYDEFDGRVHRGRTAIREAFEPQFRGDYGRIRFHQEDLFVDPTCGQGLIRWTCTLERDGRTRSWRGLDVIRFENGRVVEKLTYAKAERLRLREA